MTQRTPLAAQWRSILLAIFAISLFACSDRGSNSNPDEITGNSLLLNFTSVYGQTGELRWMETDSTKLLSDALLFDHDSKVFAHNGSIFVLESGESNLSCLDPETINDKSTILQKSLESGSFPYEIAVAGNKGYITLNSAIMDYIQVFDINTCVPSEKINLPISGANASAIKARNDTLLILLQRLENYDATKPGLLVRINANTKTLIDTIQLKLYNPNSAVLSGEKLYVSSQRYNQLDYSIDLEKSGIEVVNLASGISEILFTGTQLGGGANNIALDENSQILYVSVYVDYGDEPVKPINLNSKSIGIALPDIIDSFGGLAFDSESKKLFVGDRSLNSSGLKIYNAVSKVTTTAVDGKDIKIPPTSLAIVRW
jgi:hypothetical protein